MKKSFFYGLIGVLVVFDQLTKWYVSEYFIREGKPLGLASWLIEAPERLDYREISILPFFNIVMVWNKGVSFGLFNQQSDLGPFLLIGLALIIAVWFMIWLGKSGSVLQQTGLVLVVGGALGNVFDRFRFGAVMDFLDFHAFGYHWPAFNVADSCIVIGVFVLMAYALFFEKTLHAPSEIE